MQGKLQCLDASLWGSGPIYPATRKVTLKLSEHVSAGRLQVDIEYGGRLKDIPEFGTFPNQKQAMDDLINSRLVELASYSSWYPQFFVFGRSIETLLGVSLPRPNVLLIAQDLDLEYALVLAPDDAGQGTT